MQLISKSILVFVLGVLFLHPVCHSWAASSESGTSHLGVLLSMSLEELVDLEVELATGTLKPLKLAPAVASVITAEQIERIGAITLDEVLETVPGLHVETSGIAYFSSIWSIRGIHSVTNPHVLLLINSVPYTSVQTGGRPMAFNMPVAMISRVEVIRGPGSALHGADAFSGVINVITKDHHEIDGTQMGLRYGSFESSDLWLQHGATYNGWGLALGFEWQRSQGDKNRIIEKDFVHTSAPGFFPPADPSKSNAPGALDTAYEVLNTHLNLRKENWNFHLYSTLQDSAGGMGSIQALTYDSDIDISSLLVSLSYKNIDLIQDWQLSGRLYYSYISSDNFIQQLPPAFLNMQGNPITESQDGGVELSGVYTGFRNHQLRLGAGWKNYEYEPDQYKNFGPAADPFTNWFGDVVHVTDPAHIFMNDANRQLYYGLIQDEWAFARGWELTAGVRYDKYSDFGSTVNPRVALVWETRYDLFTKLMYGQAFRAPSFGEQWVKNNPQTIGNPNLDPEEIETLEFVMDYQPAAKVHIMTSVYAYEAKDLIGLAGALPQLYTNLGEQEGLGFEVEMEWLVMDNLKLRANYARQRSKYKDTDSLVTDAPGQQFYFNPHWIFMKNWSLDGQYTWVGDRHRANGDPRPDIGDYDVVTLTLQRKNIFVNWEATLAVRNLFDTIGRIPSPYVPGLVDGAYVPNDYPMEGRSVWAELSYSF